MSANNGLEIITTGCKWKPVIMRKGLAEQLLASLHPKQRNPKRPKIEQYCSDMLDDKWHFHPHECIGVDTEGYTMNGNNRLLAFLKAIAINPNIEIVMVICYGVPTNSMITTDTGATRSVNDAAKVQGLDFSNKSFASVARRMYEGGTGYRSQLSIQKTLDLIDDYDDGLRFVFTHLRKNAKGLTQGSVRAVVARAYYSQNKRRLEEFCEMLMSGLVNNRNTDSAVITLRNFLIEQVGGQGGRGLVKNTYYIIEKCLQAFLYKQRVFDLKPVDKELFMLPGEKEKEIVE